MLISCLQPFPTPPPTLIPGNHTVLITKSMGWENAAVKKSGFYQSLSRRNKLVSISVSKHDFKITDENVGKGGWGCEEKGMKSKDKGNSKLSELPQRFFLNKDFHEAEVRTGKTPPCPASAALSLLRKRQPTQLTLTKSAFGAPF